MERLYIAATEPNAGKSVLALSLALQARRNGASVRFAKPSAAGSTGSASIDVALALDVLGEESIVTGGTPPNLAGGDADASLVLIEGISEKDRADLKSDADAAQAAGARSVLIFWYREDAITEDVVAAAEPFGDRLAGVVLNGVPGLRMHAVETTLVPEIEAASIPVLGVLQQDRVLHSPTLRELVTFLDAEVIAFPEALDAPVENLMLGALALDGGIHYYGDTDRKVVITRWDRPDLQMPALNTGCQGLILTNGGHPIPYVWNRIQELQVPVALVQSGTVAIATSLGAGFLAQRGNPNRRKVERLADLLPSSAPGLLDLAPARPVTT
jgi:BioD-like phosphotransacetylase family protein